MNQPRFSRWFVGGVALALIAWLVGHGERGASRKPLTDSRSVTTGASTTSPARRPSYLAPEHMVAPVPSLSHHRELPPENDGRLSKLLSRRSNSFGAIRNELLLKFKSPEALRDFLSRADQSGLKILGRLDGLMVIRIGFDDLDELRAMIEGDEDVYEAVDANFIVKVPDWLNSESRPSVSGTAPFSGDGFLQAIGAEGDRSTWGTEITVAVLDTGVENHPTFGEG